MNKKEILADIIQQRQSIYPKQFTGEKISKEEVELMLKNAIDAPSHKKTNPWRFYVYSGESMQIMRNFIQKMYKKNTPVEKFSERRYKELGKRFQLTSHFIVIVMQRDPKERVPEWEEIAAVSCAVQNLYLSATAAGYGGYWSSPKKVITQYHEVASLKEGEKCLGFFYLGVPNTEKMPPKASKGELSEKVTWL